MNPSPNGNVFILSGTGTDGNYSPYNGSNNISQNLPQGFSIDPVRQMFKNKGITLSPQEETQLSQAMANRAGSDQLGTQAQALGISTAYGNSAANSNAERNLVLNAQRYNAENTANQLNSLNQARATSMQGISNAFNTGASMFR